jgi:hypothetical protein
VSLSPLSTILVGFLILILICSLLLLLFSVSLSPLSTILVGVLILILIRRLYPWHEILTEHFEDLEAITKNLEVTQAILHKKVDAVILLQADLNTRETKVLNLQNLIHHRIDNMVRKILMFLVVYQNLLLIDLKSLE